MQNKAKIKQLKQNIITNADQCVRCAKCLPYCPTYVISENEAESARGRIALLKAFALEQTDLSGKSIDYLDHCLTCRACEAVCPAEVKYGTLIDQGRELIHHYPSNSVHQKIPHLLNKLILSKTSRSFWRQVIRFYQRSGLSWLVNKTHLLNLSPIRTYTKLIKPIPAPIAWQNVYMPKGKAQGKVALFLGCISDFIDQQTLHAGIVLLNHLGYGVFVPPQQTCCGALHQHAGDKSQANLLQQQNQEIFSNTMVEAIVTTASGCSITLQEQVRLPVFDTAVFFAMNYPIKTSPLPTCNKKVLLHLPCTMRYVMRQQPALIELLKQIPGLQLLFLESELCCGAAGMQMLSFPEQANKLAARIIAEIQLKQPDLILTFNIGCELHLMNHLKNRKINIQIQHPSIFLANLLKLT
ncbi:MAG: (Fe-S)-binding protein [Pseudomonadota bacterium]